MFTFVSYRQYVLRIALCVSLYVSYRVFFSYRPSPIVDALLMDSSTNFQAPPQAVYLLRSCDKVFHKQEVCFLLYFLGQIVS